MKLVALIIILCSVGYTSISFSQTTNAFRINYDQALFDLPGNATESLTPNQFVFAGTNLNFLPIYGTVTELDAVGDLLWSKRYLDGSIGFQINDIKKDDAANEYYVCGGSESNAGVFMRLDALGNVIVSTKFEINEADGAYLNRIIKASDGGYVAVGYVTGHDPDGAGPETDFAPISYTDSDGDPQTEVIGSPLIVKFDANGNHQWHHITRYYTTGAANPGDRIYNDASFADVVEVGDGFIAVGNYDVNQHLSNTNGDGDDATATDAIILKTNLAGTIMYHRQIDNPNTSPTQNSNYLSAINKTSVGDPIAAGGTGGGRELIQKYGALGGFSLTFSRRFTYSTALFGTIVNPVDISQVYEVNGGTDIVTMGMYIQPLGFVFSNSLHRYNASATNTTWAKYYTFGLATILPRGQQTSDDGFIMSSTTLGASFDYQIIKTDPNGDTPLASCAPTSFTPAASSGPGTIGTPNFRLWSGTPQPNGLTVIVSNITPTQNVICRTTACTPPPLADNVTATPNPICAGQSATINATGPGTNVSYAVYSAASGGTSLGNVPLAVTPGVTTTYYVETVDNTDPTCVSLTRVPIVITVNPLPVVNPTSNSPLCVGETLNLNTDAVPGGTYSWTGPNGFTSSVQNPTIPNTTLAADGTYSLTVTANGCSNGPVTVNVTVAATPTATAGALDTDICEGEDIELTGNTVAGGTYSWTGPNGFTSSDQNPTIIGATASNAGTYSLEISIGSCTSTNTANVTITVNPAPTAAAGANATTICEGDDIELTSVAVPGGNYSWSGPNGFTSSNQNPTIPNASAAEGGTYSLIITTGACSSTNTAEVIITVNPTPTAAAGAVDTEICEGEDLELTGNTVAGGTYSWTGPNGFTSSDQNPIITGATVNESGTYSLTITLGACSSSNTADVVITVNPAPVVSATNNGVVCAGNDLILTATGGTTYSWTGPNGFTGNSGTETITGADVVNAGVYDVTVTDANGCSNTAQTTVTVSDGPTLTISGDDITCFGDNDGTADVVATGDGPFTYVWSPAGGTGSSASNLEPGGYSVDVTDDNGCTSTQNITIGEPTELLIATTSTNSACTTDDGTATAIPSGGTGTYTYSWSSGGTSDIETGIGAGIYIVTVTDDSGCTAQESVTVGSVNGPTLTLIGSQDISCFGANDGSAEVEATGGTPGYTYNWAPSGGTNANATGLGAGTYTATVTDNAGCTALIQVDITEPDALVVSGSATDANCGLNDGTITASVTGGAGNYTYTWTPNVGNTAGLSGLPAGTYELTVEDGNGCSVSTSFVVGLSGSIPIDVIPDVATIEAGDEVDLEVIIGGGITGANIVWSPTNGLSCINCPDPTASPDETTTYYVTVTTDDGCSATDSVIVVVNQPCGELFIPNIFSPNNDGNNDQLCLYGGCIETLVFTIYSRWGEIVFETADPTECWDGTFKGEPMNSGIFVYKAIVKLAGETEEIVKSGNINLVR